MLERKTVVDQIEIRRDDSLGIRLALLIMDGAAEISSKYFRVSIDVGADTQSVMVSTNEYLVEHGEEPVTEQDILRIAEHAKHATAAD